MKKLKPNWSLTDENQWEVDEDFIQLLMDTILESTISDLDDLIILRYSNE